MITKSDIEIIQSIFKQIIPNLADSIQIYDESQKCRISHLVKFEKNKK